MRATSVLNREKRVMYILMVGNPHMGFTFVGPYTSAEAANDAGEWARIEYGDGYSNDWWLFELNALLEDPHIEGEDLAGTAIVFAGSIIGDPSKGEGWGFYGPFKDIEAARKWAAADGLGIDCAIALQPVEESLGDAPAS
jgi:hypothetical protein